MTVQLLLQPSSCCIVIITDINREGGNPMFLRVQTTPYCRYIYDKTQDLLEICLTTWRTGALLCGIFNFQYFKLASCRLAPECEIPSCPVKNIGGSVGFPAWLFLLLRWSSFQMTSARDGKDYHLLTLNVS